MVSKVVRFEQRVSLFGIVTILISVILLACSSTSTFQGTELKPRRPALSFELKNQFGQSSSLQDFKGEVVVLTFLYTSCANVCPIVTGQLRDVYEILGGSDGVQFIAISVDPLGDSVQAAYDYSVKWSMLDKWLFLVGSEDDLSPIWKAYFIDPVMINHFSKEEKRPGKDPSSLSGLQKLSEGIVEKYSIIHSTPMYLIDRTGTMRVVTTPPFDAEDLVHDIRLILDD